MTITSTTAKSGPYNGNGVTVAFDYDFLVLDEADVVVTLTNSAGSDTVKTLTTDYTVSGVGNEAGGAVTMLVAPATGEKLTLTRSTALTQTVDLQNRKAVAPEVLEDAFDKITLALQDADEQLGRAIKIGVASDISALDQLISDVTALGAIESDISVVAGISANVTTVAGIAASVTTVAGVASGVSTLAPIAANITTVAGISANVTTVAGIAANVTTVAGVAANVTTVAGIAANVTTVAGISADVTAVAGVSADVDILGGIAANITTVAGIAANVTTVAGIAADVTEVASISAAVTTLAGGAGGTVTGNFTATGVWDFTSTEALRVPVGTTAQRPSVPAQGDIRRNTTTGAWEGYTGTGWGNLGGAGLFKGENGESGDTSAGSGDIFRVHQQELNTNTTIDADENAVAAGPLTVASGVTLTVSSGGNLVIV